MNAIGGRVGALRSGPIDIHAHCVPEEFLSLLTNSGDPAVEAGADGYDVALSDGRAPVTVGRGLVDLDDRLAAMDSQGVAVQVLSPFMDLAGYHLRCDEAVTWAQRYNDALAREADRFPDRLAGLATVPLDDGAAAAVELTRAIDQLGMVGVEVGSHAGERQLDDEDLEVFWAEASARRAIVLLHPIDPLPGIDLSDYGLVHLVGRPAETTIAAGRLIFSGLMDRHLGLRVVVAHGGGFLPYQIGRLAKGHFLRPENSPALKSPPREVLSRLYFDSVLSDPRALLALAGMVGHERVLLGSDFPFGIGDLDPVRSVASAFDDGAQVAITRQTGWRLMADVRASR